MLSGSGLPASAEGYVLPAQPFVYLVIGFSDVTRSCCTPYTTKPTCSPYMPEVAALAIKLRVQGLTLHELSNDGDQ